MISISPLTSPQSASSHASRPNISLLAGLLLVTVFSVTISVADTITVTTLVDEDVDNAVCSLREAITAANDDAATNGCVAGNGDDLIGFSVAGTINLTSDLTFISDGLEIAGPGVDDLIIDGQDAFRLFSFEDADGTGLFTLSGLTLTRGASSSGPAVNAGTGQSVVINDAVLTGNTSTNGGGAISLFGSPGSPASLTLERVTISDNEAQGPSSGGAVRVGNNEVTVTITESAFIDNRATHENGNGGGLLALGTTADVNVSISNSTFDGNQSNDSGAGLKLIGSSSAVVLDSTFTNNTADADGDGDSGGGGISSSGGGTVTLGNTIVAGNSVGGNSISRDVENDTFSSNGFNFIGVNAGAVVSFPAGNPNVNGDYVGTAGVPLDPLLAPLADNGGPTLSHMPDLVTSPVIDAGSCTGSLNDQRGYGNPSSMMRIFDSQDFPNADDACDIGAVEAFTEAILGPLIFEDGFESGDGSAWSATFP